MIDPTSGRPPAHELLDASTAATVLGVSPATLRDWARRGLLPKYGTARRALYAWSDLAAARDAPKPRRVLDADQGRDHDANVTTRSMTS